MAGNASNQRIIPLEEGWNDEIKAKVRSRERSGRVPHGMSFSARCWSPVHDVHFLQPELDFPVLFRRVRAILM
jgi:hypothetical protein